MRHGWKPPQAVPLLLALAGRKVFPERVKAPVVSMVEKKFSTR